MDSFYFPLLVKKLESYRFSDKALDLVRSFFHNRQNRVKLASVLSQLRVLKRGCPRGSCFGPLLWNIYQNDLNNYFKDRNISMYAVFVSGISLQNVSARPTSRSNYMVGSKFTARRAILRSIKPSRLGLTKSTSIKL